MFHLIANTKDLIKILQNTSETTKKIVIAMVVVAVAIVLGFFWLRSAAHSIATAGSSLTSTDLKNIVPQDVKMVDKGVDKAMSDPFANWKTYTNAKYGFQIKYKKTWMVQENKKSLEYGLIFCLADRNGCTGKRVNEENKNEVGPIYLFTSKKGNEKPTHPSNYYLGTDDQGTDYYLFSEFPKNDALAQDMISTFKLIK